ncbi:hypothetical protein SBOR_9608 [Sclerotinia borealis F-4128]|uniref:SET domain-containing protein n=1 Tax=Sclerotinia borealis (strain F-4128) TaxID=1432307 RepID=W9C605_SCLBF|nr:hypothetical protein SBOR_9608 [Sclerotinia borealis F-4128]
MPVINTFFDCKVVENIPDKMRNGICAHRVLKAVYLIVSNPRHMVFGSKNEITKESIKSMWETQRSDGALPSSTDEANFEDKLYSVPLQQGTFVDVRLVRDVAESDEITISYCALDESLVHPCVYGSPFYQAINMSRRMIRAIGEDIKYTDRRNTQHGEHVLKGMVALWTSTVEQEWALPFLWEIGPLRKKTFKSARMITFSITPPCHYTTIPPNTAHAIIQTLHLNDAKRITFFLVSSDDHANSVSLNVLQKA